jgi:hypothetical protein
LASAGTLTAFVAVCTAMLKMRRRELDRERRSISAVLDQHDRATLDGNNPAASVGEEVSDIIWLILLELGATPSSEVGAVGPANQTRSVAGDFPRQAKII